MDNSKFNTEITITDLGMAARPVRGRSAPDLLCQCPPHPEPQGPGAGAGTRNGACEVIVYRLLDNKGRGGQRCGPFVLYGSALSRDETLGVDRLLEKTDFQHHFLVKFDVRRGQREVVIAGRKRRGEF